MRKFLAGFALGLVALPILGIAAARLGLLPVRATSQPPDWEARFARGAIRASLARDSANLASPIADDDETLLAGMKLYRNDCAGCHGEPGRASHWGTTGFYPRVPQLSDRPSALTAPQMYLVVKRGIRYSGMGAWDGELSDPDIWRVATFLSRIHSLPPAVQGAWKSKP